MTSLFLQQEKLEPWWRKMANVEPLNSSQLDFLFAKSWCCEILVLKKYNRPYVRLIMCSRVLRKTHVCFTASSACSEVAMSPFGLELSITPPGHVEYCYQTVCVYESPFLLWHCSYYWIRCLYLSLFVLNCEPFDQENAYLWPYDFLTCARPCTSRVQGAWMPCRWLHPSQKAQFSWGQNTVIRPTHARTLVDSAALRPSPEEDYAFCILTYIFCTHFYSFLTSACPYRGNLDAWNPWEMYPVEVRALLWMLGSMPESVTETFRFTSPSYLPLVEVGMDETGMRVVCGPWSVQSGLKTPTILPGLEDNNFLYGMEIQDSNTMTGEKITLRRNKREDKASPVAMTKAFKIQVPVPGCWLSNAVQPLPPTGTKEESVWDTAIPAPHVKLSKNSSTTSATLSSAMKPICSVYYTDFRALT